MSATNLTRISPYTAQQMYDMVADVGKYDQFVPYCTAVRVSSQSPADDVSAADEGADKTTLMQADLMIAYKMVRERYVSNVMLDAKNLKINVAQISGPFQTLDNRWHFVPTKTGCAVHFLLDFDFRVPFLRNLIRPITEQAVEKFVQAFETRADELYGDKNI